MWKLVLTLILLSALCCIGQCHQVPKSYVDATSSVKSYSVEYPKFLGRMNVVTLKNRLYTVLLSNEHDQIITIKSIYTSNRQSQEELVCKLASPDKFEFGSLRTKVVVLGNGKLVLVTPSRTDQEGALFLHIIIDPFDCSSQKIVKVQYPTEDYLQSSAVIALIPYQDSYDVIDNYKTYPERFNDKGEKIELDYSRKLNLNSLFDDSINTIKPFNASEGYYCSYYNEAEGRVLQRLNSRFEIVKQISFNSSHGNIGVSTTYGHINYCIFEEKTTCKLLNADLDVQATSELPTLHTSGVMMSGVPLVTNLPGHRGLIVYLGIYHPDHTSTTDNLPPRMSFNSTEFYLQRVDGIGFALPRYWKIADGSTYIIIHDYYGISYGTEFCHAMLNQNLLDDSELEFKIRCLDLYSY